MFVFEHLVVFMQHGLGQIREKLPGGDQFKNLGVGPGWGDDGGDQDAGVNDDPDHFIGCLLFFFISRRAAATAALISRMDI